MRKASCTAIAEGETGGQLAERLAELGAVALGDSVDRIAQGGAIGEVQDHTAATYAPKIDRSLTHVTFDDGARAAARRAKVQLEMGGKNPLIVLNDADLEVAVNCAVQGAFFSTGQRCTASSRLIVEKGLHDRFVKRMCEVLAALRIGNALAAETQVGPVVDGTQLERNFDYIRIGKEEGATLAFGESELLLRGRG